MVNVYPLEDTCVRSWQPNQTMGGQAVLGLLKTYYEGVTYRGQVWAKFDVGDYNLGDYVSFVLHYRIKHVSWGEGETTIQKIVNHDPDAWDESTLTWNNKPGADLVVEHDMEVNDERTYSFNLLPYLDMILDKRSGNVISLSFYPHTIGIEFYISSKEMIGSHSDTLYIEYETTTPEAPEENFFRSIGDWFYNFDSIPLLSYPLRWLSTPFYTADDWVNTINGYVTIILSWTQIDEKIRAKYNMLLHSWTDVTDLIPSWTNLVPEGFPTTLDELMALMPDPGAVLPSWFPTSLTKLKLLIVDTISDTWTLFGDTASDIVTKAKTTILGWFPYDITDAQSLLRWIGIEAGDVITSILDTPADMFEWIKAEIENNYSILKMKWFDITEMILYVLVASKYWGLDAWVDFKFLVTWASKESWEGFGKNKEEFIEWLDIVIPDLPEWIPTSMMELKALIIDTISDAFESVLNKVFKEEE